MSKSISSVLVESYKKLLNQLVEIQEKLDVARECSEQKSCVLCDATSMCTPHAQLDALLALDHNKKIQSLESELNEAKDKINVLDAQVNELRVINESIPAKIENAKKEAVKERDELVARDVANREFIMKLAYRLSIPADSTLERLKSMIDDSIRKSQKQR